MWQGDAQGALQSAGQQDAALISQPVQYEITGTYPTQTSVLWPEHCSSMDCVYQYQPGVAGIKELAEDWENYQSKRVLMSMSGCTMSERKQFVPSLFALPYSPAHALHR